MFKFLLPILVSATLTTTASAQSNTDSTSDAASSAQNSLIFEGSNPAASSASVGGAMHTAPCIIGNGIALGVVGGAIAFSNGKIETSCLAREEAEWVINLLGMPNGVQKTAAVLHACTNVPSIRQTLTSIGVCVGPASEAVAPVSMAYSFCGMVDGVFTVRIPSGGNAELASEQCMASR
jgi:hypothetical protein